MVLVQYIITEIHNICHLVILVGPTTKFNGFLL